MMNSNRRSIITKIFLLLGSACLFIGIIYFLKFGINLFKVKHIEVLGDSVQLEINESIFVNNILFFPSESVVQKIKLDNPQVMTVEIRKKFPSTLVFIIYKRTPIAEIITSGIYLGIDEDSVITEEISTNHLPIITIDIPLARVGTKVKHPMIVQTIALINKTKSFIQWMQFESFETQSIRAKTGQTDILITQTSDLTYVRDTLQTLMEGFRIKGTMPKSIDLRFSKPVVQF